MTIDIDGFLSNLDRFRAEVLAKMEREEDVTSEELYGWQPALLAYTAWAIIKQQRAENVELRALLAEARPAVAQDEYGLPVDLLARIDRAVAP